ncbi:TonB-dependent receptor plug domain-containing protein [Pontixanthobacter gangjinensis]|uniref:TonB-dependent receptor plug domain-containing protein n=1 Tax=Pontixanthobacter gangjinensis TaxID=1028742 RepID=A0A6I4SNA5_9SPHN|nr:TonB-dependent receptor plug domain-containing protein [Pontixanthobacter gangjinensis]MXO56317.1 TonB-dependent receptor plug domain-containing protein [Pontixanthobacter gangjinensis]
MAAFPPELRIFSARAFALLPSGVALCFCAPLVAQESLPDISKAVAVDASAAATAETSVSEGRGQVYAPEYFARIAPRNALDMLQEVPGFNIQGGGGGGRGLGQADENILINGGRLSSKSDSARDQLSRIPADKVVRIEIVDGTTLDIPGLTGQVANIITSGGGMSGQFVWRGSFRPETDRQELFGGEISASGSAGNLDYTIAARLQNNRFGAVGPGFIYDANGTLLETQDGGFKGKFDEPSISANLKYDFGKDVTANLNLSYEKEIFDAAEQEFLSGTGLVDRNRDNIRRNREYEYEISADIEFPLGSGKLKLIGLESFQNRDFTETVTTGFGDSSDDEGGRFAQISDQGERIVRGEYNWPMFDADWQITGEAAFNRLDNVASLFELDGGEFAPIAFPEGTGGVREDRYETALSFSKQLTPELGFQATGGAEFSKITQSGSAANARSFKRPKGSASLSWRPEKGLDISLEARRVVGQLSFGDVLARVFLDDGNQNGGNNELVPEQRWDIELEINKTLGAWGSTNFTVTHRMVEDYIDVIPLLTGGEARGNIDKAKRTDFNWNTTLKFDPLGVPGAQVDLEFQIIDTNVRDPLTGISRAFSQQRNKRFRAEFRHDIPSSDWAYGANIFHSRNNRYLRLSEVGRNYEGPTFADVFIEHKDVFGLTVSATAANLLGGKEFFERTVYDGPRTDNQIAFIEERARDIGPIFRFSVSGNF